MTANDLERADNDTWVFAVDGFHLDAPQQAKSEVYEENDVKYNYLRARVMKHWGSKYVVVINTEDDG